MVTWEFTNETKEVYVPGSRTPITVRRIRATRDIKIRYRDGGRIRRLITKGTLGGWIENESNLIGGWVGGNAIVCGRSVVKNSALVDDDAVVFSSEISGYARVYGCATVEFCVIQDLAKVYGNAHLHFCEVIDSGRVLDNATIEKLGNHATGRILVSGNAAVHGGASVMSDAAARRGVLIGDRARICGAAHVENLGGDLIITDSATVCGCATVVGSGFISDHAHVGGYSVLRGHFAVSDQAVVEFPPQAENYDYALHPYYVLDGKLSVTNTESCLIMGPFRGAEENVFLTFVADENGGVHLCTDRPTNPICLSPANTEELQSQLGEYDYFSDDVILEIVAAYEYAKACLLNRQQQKG